MVPLCSGLSALHATSAAVVRVFLSESLLASIERLGVGMLLSADELAQ